MRPERMVNPSPFRLCMLKQAENVNAVRVGTRSSEAGIDRKVGDRTVGASQCRDHRVEALDCSAGFACSRKCQISVAVSSVSSVVTSRAGMEWPISVGQTSLRLIEAGGVSHWRPCTFLTRMVKQEKRVKADPVMLSPGKVRQAKPASPPR